MNRLRRINSITSPALVVFLASVFLFAPIAYAQNSITVGSLAHNERVINRQKAIVSEKSESVKLTSRQLSKLKSDKIALAKAIENEKKTSESLKHQIEQKRLQREQAERQRVQLAQAVTAEKPTQTTRTAPTGQGAMSGCGDNQYAAYIYGQESGGRVTGNCNPSAVNAGGCRGIGQACPGGKLPCGADYACQNAWFNNYAIERYGSWAVAYNFHKANGWW